MLVLASQQGVCKRCSAGRAVHIQVLSCMVDLFDSLSMWAALLAEMERIILCRCTSCPLKTLFSKPQVLYLTEAIDEVVFTNLATYDGKQLMDVSREGLEMDEEEGSKVRQFGYTPHFPLLLCVCVCVCVCVCADAAQVVTVGSTWMDTPLGVHLTGFGAGCTACALWHGCGGCPTDNCTPFSYLMCVATFLDALQDLPVGASSAAQGLVRLPPAIRLQEAQWA